MCVCNNIHSMVRVPSGRGAYISHTGPAGATARQQEHVLVITSKHSLTGHLGRGIGKYKQFTNIKRSYELSFSSIISISDS